MSLAGFTCHHQQGCDCITKRWLGVEEIIPRSRNLVPSPWLLLSAPATTVPMSASALICS